MRKLNKEEIFNIYITSIPLTSVKGLINYLRKKHKFNAMDAASIVEEMDFKYPFDTGLKKSESMELINDLENLGVHVSSKKIPWDS